MKILKSESIRPNTNEARANHGTGFASQEKRVKHQLRQCDRRDARRRAKLAAEVA